MFSLAELKRTANLLEPLLLNSRLQKAVQPSADKLVLELYGFDEAAGKGVKRWLVFSATAKDPFVALTDAPPESPPWPPEFAALVKAKAHRSFVKGVRIVNEDRQIALLLEDKNGAHELLFSMMGTQSNVYLIDLQGKLVGAMRDLTRQGLNIGGQWVNPKKPENPTDGEDSWRDISDSEFLQTVATHFTGRAQQQVFEQLQQQCKTALHRELKALDKRVSKIQQDIEKAQKNEAWKRQGELLKQVIGQVSCGDESVSATDFETGEEVVIKLDPFLEPSENMERLFKKYKKGAVGEVKLGEQLTKLEAERAPLQALAGELETKTDLGVLRSFANDGMMLALRKAHYPDEFKPKRRPKKERVKSDIPGRMLPKRYASADGLEIWVGKSDEGNDYLTTKLANGKDWFFHVQGYPGSHTILRTAGREDPPPESVLEAAELCVHFSKMKNATRVDVHIAPIKYVTKPKGAKAGLVHVSRGKTIGLRREPKRLERIMNARIND
ncbi:NFACT RNA binding domain-containing protein [Planctomycetota bacterium]|nr:NFACT RNA binding domain-containing protein [Planctomycetota bacterium]